MAITQDYINRVYFGFSYQFWNLFSSQETNDLLQTAAVYVEEDDDGGFYPPVVQTPFFLNGDRQ